MNTPNQPITAMQSPKDAENAIVRDLAQLAVTPKANPHPDGLPFVIVPQGHAIAPVPIGHIPNRHRGTVKLRDALSFVAYVNRYGCGTSTIYATMDPARFVAVLNDHDSEQGVAGWRDWRADFTLPASREWQTWTKGDRRDVGQIAFAEFIEDNLPDIVSPSGDALMKMVLNFEATKASAFKGVHRLQDGSAQVQWVDEVKGNGSTTIPASIALSIPVFENGENYNVDARFRYRISDGKLTMRYELVRPHKVLESAFREVWDAIAKGVCMTPLLGTPE
jgi:hypothetical protein